MNIQEEHARVSALAALQNATRKSRVFWQDTAPPDEDPILETHMGEIHIRVERKGLSVSIENQKVRTELGNDEATQTQALRLFDAAQTRINRMIVHQNSIITSVGGIPNNRLNIKSAMLQLVRALTSATNAGRQEWKLLPWSLPDSPIYETETSGYNLRFTTGEETQTTELTATYGRGLAGEISGSNTSNYELLQKLATAIREHHTLEREAPAKHPETTTALEDPPETEMLRQLVQSL